MQKKDAKVGNKTSGQRKAKEKREWERKIEIDLEKKTSKFWLQRMREKQNSCLITSD